MLKSYKCSKYTKYSNLIFNSKDIIDKKHIKNYLMLASFIENHICDLCKREDQNEVFFSKVGFQTEGPLLVGFSKWLIERLTELDIERIYFLSRDGQIMKKAFDVTCRGEFSTNYMYASRRSFIVPTLWMYDSLEELTQAMFFPIEGTISAFLHKVGLNESNYTELLKRYGYEPYENYTYNKLFIQKAFLDFYNEIREDINKNSLKEFNALAAYLEKINFQSKVAIIDIGWRGNMQKALMKVCNASNIDADIYGFYMGLNPNMNHLNEDTKMEGYLFQKGKLEKYYELERNFTSLFEMMFTADHGSVKRFILDTDEIAKPEFEEYEYQGKDTYIEKTAISSLQDGAMQFVESALNEPEFAIDWDPDTVFQNLVLLGNAPDKSLSDNFGNLRFFGDKVSYLAKPQKISHYIFHLKDLKKDLIESPWGIGFLRRLLGSGFPCYEVYSAAKKIYLLSKKISG